MFTSLLRTYPTGKHCAPQKWHWNFKRNIFCLIVFPTPVLFLLSLSYFISFPTFHPTPSICTHYRNSFPDSFLTLISFALKHFISVASLLLSWHSFQHTDMTRISARRYDTYISTQIWHVYQHADMTRISARRYDTYISTQIWHVHQHADMTRISAPRYDTYISTQIWHVYQHADMTGISARRSDTYISMQIWQVYQHADMTGISARRYDRYINTQIWHVYLHANMTRISAHMYLLCSKIIDGLYDFVLNSPEQK